eukprot:5418220-Prymnesium_polylepis.1
MDKDTAATKNEQFSDNQTEYVVSTMLWYPARIQTPPGEEGRRTPGHVAHSRAAHRSPPQPTATHRSPPQPTAAHGSPLQPPPPAAPSPQHAARSMQPAARPHAHAAATRRAPCRRRYTVRFNLGTMALGSLVLSVVEILRVVLELIDRQTRDLQSQSGIAKMLLRCCKCWCVPPPPPHLQSTCRAT